MPLMQRILFAIRTLTEDDPPPPRRKRRQHTTTPSPQRNNNSSSRRQQAVNMVITFRDLFASGGLNFLLEDDNPRGKKNNSLRKKTLEYSNSKTCLIDLSPEENSLTTTKCLSFSSEQPSLIDNTSVCLPVTSLLREERVISSPEITFPLRLDSSTPISTQLEVFGRKRRKAVTVPLSPDDENKTVAALRKVLKWSPTKQNLATFAVKLPKEEEHKVVAVVQNAVNRVKEEQQRKKKRKWRLFKLTFC